jgi:hypothetical protein
LVSEPLSAALCADTTMQTASPSAAALTGIRTGKGLRNRSNSFADANDPPLAVINAALQNSTLRHSNRRCETHQ